MRKLEIDIVDIPLSRPFTISRETRTAITVVRVKIEENEFVGVGECTPTARYGETPQSVVTQLNKIKVQVENGVSCADLQTLLPAGAARNAIDCALWRLNAQAAKQTLWEATKIPTVKNVKTAETISLDNIEAMTAAAAKAVEEGALLLKIKLDAFQIVEKVSAIRHVAPNTMLIIDANEAWGKCDLYALFKELHQYDISMIEQPLPAGDDDVLANFEHIIPICADESCHTANDIANLQKNYEFINIKLDKCGGLTEALKMVKIAEKYQMRLMVGCMLGSSLAMSAALPIATKCELVDLDGPIWLAVDSAPYLEYRQGKIWV